MELGRLKEWRLRRAFSQRELAAVAEVGLTTLNRLEVGRQRAHPATVRKLAVVLRVEPAELVGKHVGGDRDDSDLVLG